MVSDKTSVRAACSNFSAKRKALLRSVCLVERWSCLRPGTLMHAYQYFESGRRWIDATTSSKSGKAPQVKYLRSLKALLVPLEGNRPFEVALLGHHCFRGFESLPHRHS